LAAAHDARAAEHREMLGGVVERDAGGIGKRVDGHLPVAVECIDELDPLGLGHHLEPPGDQVHHCVRDRARQRHAQRRLIPRRPGAAVLPHRHCWQRPGDGAPEWWPVGL